MVPVLLSSRSLIGSGRAAQMITLSRTCLLLRDRMGSGSDCEGIAKLSHVHSGAKG